MDRPCGQQTHPTWPPNAALASLELCTWFLLAFCCIVFALQSTSGPRCTHRSRRCRMPTRAPLTTWGASSRNRENLAASVVIRDQWERRSPAVHRGPAAYRQLDQGAASHRTKQRPSAMARPGRHHAERARPRGVSSLAPGRQLDGTGLGMEISCSVIAASPPPSRALGCLSDHPPFFEEESVASHSLRRRACRSLKYTDTHPATLARPPAAPVLLPSFHHRRFSLHHRPGSRCAALSLLRLRDTLSPAPPTSTPFSPSPSRRPSPPSRQHRPNE